MPLITTEPTPSPEKKPQKSNVWKKVALLLFSLFFPIFFLEVSGQIGYRFTKGKWLFLEAPLRASDFMEMHPWLVAAPKPGTSGILETLKITHNSYGTRGPEFKVVKDPSKIRIITLGGSSTYCIGISDEDTWPYKLQKELGEKYEIINFGVMGYTTAENLIQTALTISDLKPDIAIYYEGWNDARNTHVIQSKADYSQFHGKSEFYTHSLFEYTGENRSVLGLIVKKNLKKFRNPYGYTPPQGDLNKFTVIPDERALAIYRRNLNLLVVICRELKIQPVFVPQVMNYEYLENRNEPYGWLPFVKDRDIKAVIKGYNDAMKDAAAKNGIPFYGEVLEEKYLLTDFIKDAGHFSPEGSGKFAKILAQKINVQKIALQQP